VLVQLPGQLCSKPDGDADVAQKYFSKEQIQCWATQTVVPKQQEHGSTMHLGQKQCFVDQIQVSLQNSCSKENNDGLKQFQ